MSLRQQHLFNAQRMHEHIVQIYKAKYAKEPVRDWRTYEQRIALRIKTAAMEIDPLVEEAYGMIRIVRSKQGRPSGVSTPKKVLLLLLKDIFQLSNRKMANFLAMFTALTGIDISYKSVERCYTDDLARMTIHNLYALMAKRKGITQADTTGDGTGYGVTVTKHYRQEREKALKGAKGGQHKAGTKPFVYAFGLMDLDTHLYIGYGTSMKSEKRAFRRAVEMAREAGIAIRSTRLDKYYSCQSITNEFGKETTIYIIPKKNASIRGSAAWKRILQSYIDNPYGHLAEYYRRNHSEVGFSADKRMSGWRVGQKREERIDTALLCKGIWHNLLLMA